MTVTCTHCDEQIQSVSRTGDKRYACGECNLVVAYDHIRDHLDELEVIDKRNKNNNTKDKAKNKEQPATQEQNNPTVEDSGEQNITETEAPSHTLNDREKIYQRGVDGLKEIKEERLSNWLSQTDGVGNQTEQRVMMVFNRNESVHRNPHVLFNLLDDELNASGSYLNTMVQDIFAPEEEHSDLLTSQGYTPWQQRSMGGQPSMQGQGMGGPMNATGMSGFNQGTHTYSQSAAQSQPGRQQRGMTPQQQGTPNPETPGSQNEQQDQSENNARDDSISRQEAEMMMRQAMEQAETGNQRRNLVDGLSDATDEALREMATNVGGLAGTFQRVIDEALVGYARENPEWVIENMDILQKFMNATEDMSSGGRGDSNKQPEQDRKVDDAVGSVLSSGNQDHSQEATPHGSVSTTQRQNTHQNTHGNDHASDQMNPDIDDSYMQESGFEPGPPTSNEPEYEPEDVGSDPVVDEQTVDDEEDTESDSDTEDQEPEQSDTTDDPSFEDLFGDSIE
jgi:hypothetical protein